MFEFVTVSVEGGLCGDGRGWKRGLIRVGKHPRAKNGREHAKEGWIDSGDNKPSQLSFRRQTNEYEEPSEFARFPQNFIL
jgi:hypothetical protein